MKEIRINLTEEEYRSLRADADRLGISVKKFSHDCVIGAVPENSPLYTAQMLCNESVFLQKVSFFYILKYYVSRRFMGNCVTFHCALLWAIALYVTQN